MPSNDVVNCLAMSFGRNILFVAQAISAVCGQAQTRNTHWTTAGYLISFSGGVPHVVDSTTETLAYLGTAVMSDTAGNCLMIAGSEGLFDASLIEMPMGQGPFLSFGSTQTSLVLPRPGSTDHYDVFYKHSSAGAPDRLARHLVVDIGLNGGSGDVVPGSQTIFGQDSLTAKLTGTTHANGTDYWILLHGWNSDAFLAYPVTSAGLDTMPVISHCGSSHFLDGSDPVNQNFQGQMVFNQNGNMVALAVAPSYPMPMSPSIVQLFNFDQATGAVGYFCTLPSNHLSLGIEYSPGGSKLYVTGIDSVRYLDQYDLSDLDTALIQASRFRLVAEPVSGGSQPSHMWNGPDGKVWVRRTLGSPFGQYAAINSPDELGAACALDWNAFSLGTNGGASSGFPNQLKRYHDSDLAVPALDRTNTADVLRIFPNPATTTAWVDLPRGQEVISLTIHDAAGRAVKHMLPSPFKIQPIDIHGLAQGSYTIRAVAREGSVRSALLVVR